MDVIAEYQLVAKLPDSDPVTVSLRIGRPTPHPRGDFVCSVQAEGLGLRQEPIEIFGVSSWQALMLGLWFMRSTLAAEVARGAKFYWEDGEHAISVEELFALHKFE